MEWLWTLWHVMNPNRNVHGLKPGEPQVAAVWFCRSTQPKWQACEHEIFLSAACLLPKKGGARFLVQTVWGGEARGWREPVDRHRKIDTIGWRHTVTSAVHLRTWVWQAWEIKGILIALQQCSHNYPLYNSLHVQDAVTLSFLFACFCVVYFVMQWGLCAFILRNSFISTVTPDVVRLCLTSAYFAYLAHPVLQ